MFKREELSKLLKSTTKKTYGFCKAKNTHCKDPNNPWLEFFQDPILLSTTLLSSSLCSQASRNTPSSISPPLPPSSEPHLLPQPSWRSLCSDGLFLSQRAFSVLICWITRLFLIRPSISLSAECFSLLTFVLLKESKKPTWGLCMCVCVHARAHAHNFFLKRYLAIGCGSYLTPCPAMRQGLRLSLLCVFHIMLLLFGVQIPLKQCYHAPSQLLCWHNPLLRLFQVFCYSSFSLWISFPIDPSHDPSPQGLIINSVPGRPESLPWPHLQLLWAPDGSSFLM